MANNHVDYLPFKILYAKRQSLKLVVFFVALNCICLSFMQIHALFYFHYILYSGLLIFRCQNVATLTLSYFE